MKKILIQTFFVDDEVQIQLDAVMTVVDVQLEELEQRIRGMNAIAKIYRTRDAQIEMDALLGVNAFDLDNALQINPEFLNETDHEHDEFQGGLAG